MQCEERRERVPAAVLFAIGAAVLAASDAVIVRALDGTVHPFVIAFFRALFASFSCCLSGSEAAGAYFEL